MMISSFFFENSGVRAGMGPGPVKPPFSGIHDGVQGGVEAARVEGKAGSGRFRTGSSCIRFQGTGTGEKSRQTWRFPFGCISLTKKAGLPLLAVRLSFHRIVVGSR
jgi:hypothetical protein